MSSREKDLTVDKKQPISKENFEVVKKVQNLQQVIELKIEDTTCQNFDKEVKEKKVKLIVDNDKSRDGNYWEYCGRFNLGQIWGWVRSS